MPATLTCSQMAMLFDIGGFDPGAASGSQQRDLDGLLATGYVEPGPDADSAPFQMTPMGLAFMRGELREAAE